MDRSGAHTTSVHDAPLLVATHYPRAGSRYDTLSLRRLLPHTILMSAVTTLSSRHSLPRSLLAPLDVAPTPYHTAMPDTL
ncbi:hypothetical protein VNO80_03344 [Phaseolus coccineus]|uniref:Uncharacterized protein n=1 Tax=Phaseolus coccineus TaxID=3886 RepID=A0AAN9NR68_PHACN